MDRLRLLRVISDQHIGLSLAEAISLADAIHGEFTKTRTLYDLTTFDGRVAFARSRPEVMQYVGTTYDTSKKIKAIKELRGIMAATPGAYEYSGLKECKDIVDTIIPPYSNYNL